ncbi:MAG: DUF4332 domain-containing protein [bacterium]
MNNRDDFATFLKRKGKKEHVINGLILRVENYEKYLLEKRKHNLINSNKADLIGFINHHNDNKSALKQSLRSIALFYSFISNADLAKLALVCRSGEINKTKKPFELKGFKHIEKKHLDALKENGIINVSQMIENANTKQARLRLAKSTGIQLNKIIEYVKLSDLCQISGVKGIRAKLYYDAGVDTLDKLSKWTPAKLRKTLINFVDKSKFKGIAPLPKEIKSTIASAKKLKSVVSY